jgi:hypothetical protein
MLAQDGYIRKMALVPAAVSLVQRSGEDAGEDLSQAEKTPEKTQR